MKFILMSLLIVTVSFGEDKIIASCSNNQSELFDLTKQTTKGYKKDSLKIDLIMRNDKMFVKSDSSESPLIYVGGNQFIEQVASGHNVLYTYFDKRNILTIQKSYDLFGPIMVNNYLQCD